MELFKVHKQCKITFNLIIENDDTNGFNNCMNRYKVSSNEYLKFIPYPFVTVDISLKQELKTEGWHSGLSFNLNRRDCFCFILALRYIQKILREKDEELFYYTQDEVLKIDLQKAQIYKKTVRASSKQVLLQPSIIVVGENEYRDKGAILAINNYSNYIYLSIEDVDFFLYELAKIDFSSLSLQLINSYQLTREMEAKEINTKPILEHKEDEIVDVKKRIRIEEPNTIPEI